ncbi:MAG: outer membrane lipoprotein carrier protein LolA [Candidatus Spyradosoma sp.]
MRFRFFLSILCLALAVPAEAALPEIPADDVAGTFRQTKTLRDMDVALVSSGDFRVKKSRELFWRTRKPVEFGFLLTPQGAFQLRGNEKTPLPESAAPLMRTLYAIFDAAFSGDEAALSEIFEISRERESAALWTLVPKKGPLSEFVRKIEMRADETSLKSVTLFDASGDTTRIDFFDLRPAKD